MVSILGGVPTDKVQAAYPDAEVHRFLPNIPAEVRQGLGISDSLVRLSVGLEHVDDLWDDLQQGLQAARSGR